MSVVSQQSQFSGMSDIAIERYDELKKAEWDMCVKNALNEHLLFYRDFMDYHSDRFVDHSLLMRRKGKIVGVFPANEREGVLYSHQGLTFGGLIHGSTVYASDVMDFYSLLILYMKQHHFSRLICKPSPYHYHAGPCEAQLYALWRIGAAVVETHLSTGVDYGYNVAMTELRKRGVKKALKCGVELSESTEWSQYLEMLAETLCKHHAVPKHTSEELTLLHSRFPHRIRLVVAKKNHSLLAGVLLFLTNTTVHTQYISVNDDGQKFGALDYLMSSLLEEYRGSHRYFCFGISTEEDGRVLNHGLLHQKEGFGGRAFLHNIYGLSLL